MVLALLAVTLFGVLGGLGASLILPVHYQAEAYVVVYAMPRGFTSLISPDEEVSLQNVYRAGVLQDAVLKRVQAQLPGYSADTIAEAIQVGGVAYTPLTRITATAPTADDAARLANGVATAWVDVAGAAPRMRTHLPSQPCRHVKMIYRSRSRPTSRRWMLPTPHHRLLRISRRNSRRCIRPSAPLNRP